MNSVIEIEKKRCGNCASWESFWCGKKGVCLHTATSARVEQSCAHWKRQPEQSPMLAARAS
jgi:hypothetical protein